ncbi:MAG: DUF3383 domain-containing protein [Burkholderiaceae bacterium]|jgi:hypothetical protein|nr:DUF3383 domain-containing protein [Burkholderiaceae bacterium]
MSIPASAIVSVQPGVVSSGGSALSLNGVILTASARVPIGAVMPFSSAADAAAYFGPLSLQAALASNYFLGFDNSTIKPGTLFFAQYPAVPVAAWARGQSIGALTIAQLQAVTGDLKVTVDGVAYSVSGLDLSSATSFSAAAALLTTDLSLPTGATVTFDSIAQAFVVTSGTTGALSSISAVTGTAAAALGLASATLSQGADAASPATAMDAVTGVTQNWACFMTDWEPLISDKLAFAAWTNAQNNRYVYAAWDTDSGAAQANNPACFGAQLAASQYSGTVPIYLSVNHAAAFMGMVASIDFTRHNARITFAFKSQQGLTPSVTDQTTADDLLGNGYNFYGAYATANDPFNFFYNGQISGQFEWADAYVNQIRLNSQLQLANMTLLTNVGSVPYNTDGYALIQAACMDPINEALNFGSIRPGVTLSALQAAEVNNAAGAWIDATLSQRGWYLQVLDPGAQVRGQRGSPVITLWYTDGGAVQKINIASIDVQ